MVMSYRKSLFTFKHTLQNLADQYLNNPYFNN
jgi:hypothetical protein